MEHYKDVDLERYLEKDARDMPIDTSFDVTHLGLTKGNNGYCIVSVKELSKDDVECAPTGHVKTGDPPHLVEKYERKGMRVKYFQVMGRLVSEVDVAHKTENPVWYLKSLLPMMAEARGCKYVGEIF